MKISLTSKALQALAPDLLVLPMYQGAKKLASEEALAVDALFDGAISQLIVQDAFEAKLGTSFILPSLGKAKARKIAVVGLGEKKRLDADALRRFGGAVVKLAQASRSSHVAVSLPEPTGAVEERINAQAMAEGLLLAAYRFHTFHGKLRKEESAKQTKIEEVTISETDSRLVKAANEGIERAQIFAAATCYTRDLVNAPSSHLSPAQLVEEAKKLEGHGIQVTVMDGKEMRKLGMDAALAVARGSDHPPFGVHLAYRPKGAKKRVALVGKAVTFDSGGLSLKPDDAMMDMKIDMAGAAAVLGIFKALPALKPNVEVHGIFLAVENMPSGKAYRPGDVVTAMDGTTIEILNTDAEGRVTLADALCFARTLEPDMIIDLATLTGACIVALGDELAGLFTDDERMSRRLLDAADESGDLLWPMPLHAPYHEMVTSKIADLKNIGARGKAGASTAALFLKPFVGDTPWAHLDIAGPAYIERDIRPDLPYGATGYGVRLLARFLEKLGK